MYPDIFIKLIIATTTFTAAALTGFAQDATPAHSAANQQKTGSAGTITILGEKVEDQIKLPGSAHKLTEKELKRFDFDDVSSALERIPGVYTRVEDGNGLLPNISIRGVDAARSSKVTIMEDGVMMAPAPYSAPAAYYTPTLGRMRGLEVLKGSSQVRFGPHITGGAVNYLSSEVPIEAKTCAKAAFGSYNEMRAHLLLGNGFTNERGDFGFLLEGFGRDYHDFKKSDQFASEPQDPRDFSTRDIIAKAMWESATAPAQRIELTLGRSEHLAEASYLGISDADFDASPLRLYSGANFDRLASAQERAVLRHKLGLGGGSFFETTLYRTEFSRSWYKVETITNYDENGDGILDGKSIDLSSALAGGAAGRGLAVLKGEAAGTLGLRDNQRDYQTRGVHLQPTILLGDSIEHRIEIGLRLHEDSVVRNQRFDTVERSGRGEFADLDGDGAWYEKGEAGSGGHRSERAQALALYVSDTIDFGRFHLIPGLRTERINLELTDYDVPADNGERSLTLNGGGLGATFVSENDWRLFAGAYRGFSPPAPRAAIKSKLDPEYSVSTEVGGGLKVSSLQFGLTIFRTTFEDLIVTDNIGGSGTGESENVGAIVSQGIEFDIDSDLAGSTDLGVGLPVFTAVTYTDAQIQSDATSVDGESLFAGAKKGNEVPYIPKWKIAAGTGVTRGKFGSFLRYRYQTGTFTTANNVGNQTDPLGNPDARYGRVPVQTFYDLSTQYESAFGAEFALGIQNLLNATTMVSRHPYGPRPAKPRSWFASLSATL